MKKIYSFVKRQFIATALSLTLLSLGAAAQICGPVAEPFTNPGTGFTGDFSFNGAQQKLVRTTVIGTAVYTITTPTYKLLPGTTTLGYGFVLSGTEQVSRVEVVVMYISTLTNSLTTIFLTQFVPNYGASTSANVCRAVETTDLPGFPVGGQYRFRIEVSSSSGSGLASQTITFDDFRTNGNFSTAPLPVNFIGFDGKKNSVGVQLTWKVAGEENVARYEVERSEDGRNFTAIANLPVSKKDTYTYLDANSNSSVYYRIKNVDTDGKFKYSTIVRMANGKSSIVIKAFPQPVENQLTVQHPAVKANALVSVSSADGRIVNSIRPSSGSMQTNLNMANLQKGLYIVRFDSGDGSIETMKVVKQ